MITTENVRKCGLKMRKENNSLIKDSLAKIVDKKGFIILISLNLLSALLFVYAPITLNEVVKNVGEIKTYDIVRVVLILAAGYIVDFISVFVKNNLIQKYHGRSSEILYKNVFELKYDKYINMGPTAIRELTYNATDAYANYYFEIIPGLIVNIITIVVTIVIAFTLNHIAAILMFATLPIHYFGFRTLNRKLSELSINLRDSSSKSAKNINSIISQIDFIKQNSQNDRLIPRIITNILETQGVRKRVNYVANGASGLLIGVNQIIQNLTIILLASLALKNKDAFGGVVYVMLVFPYFSNAIRGLTFANLGFAEHKAADEFLETLIKFKEKDGNRKMPDNIENIKFKIKSVDILDKNLINDINLEFKKGDVVGIMGESGTGKSTFVKLIPKFRYVEGISINDIPIEEIRNDEYRQKVSYYSQNTPIITDTIYNNLNFGRDNVDKESYENMRFLSKFTNLDEVIVENGSNLSGGDKQRIALSRFFVESAQIVILDEPTSSLDKLTETEIMSDVLKNTKDKIIFIISHNPSIMDYCTHIVELKNKKVYLKNLKESDCKNN